MHLNEDKSKQMQFISKTGVKNKEIYIYIYIYIYIALN
jgi:hypothetical protein